MAGPTIMGTHTKNSCFTPSNWPRWSSGYRFLIHAVSACSTRIYPAPAPNTPISSGTNAVEKLTPRRPSRLQPTAAAMTGPHLPRSMKRAAGMVSTDAARRPAPCTTPVSV